MICSDFLLLCVKVTGNTEKAREILVEALEHVQLSKPLLEVFVSCFSFLCWIVLKWLGFLSQSVTLFLLFMQALIHLESIQSIPKRIDYLDSLVDKFIVTNPESPNAASAAEREELSSIFLEVSFVILLKFVISITCLLIRNQGGELCLILTYN